MNKTNFPFKQERFYNKQEQKLPFYLEVDEFEAFKN